jgi:uncharacterized membrane protein
MAAALSLLSTRLLLADLHLPTPVWWFYALGPQLAICLGLGYWTARRRGGDLVRWLAAAFLASLVPVAGVLFMLWLWWRSPTATPTSGGGHQAGAPQA